MFYTLSIKDTQAAVTPCSVGYYSGGGSVTSYHSGTIATAIAVTANTTNHKSLAWPPCPIATDQD
jgi:hypothetical protein